MGEVLSLILGGGRGTRLYPLTQMRSKPAVPVAGKYRLIDIPISNCLNSGLNRIYVLTQFLSVSLHRHIANTYKFDPFSKGFVEVLAAQQTNEKADWYQGTADAVRQQIRYVVEDPCREVLILSGDQLYRMDFRQLIRTHRQTGADITIAVIPVPREQVPGFGIVRLDDSGRVIQFAEKPKTESEISPYHTSPEWMARHGINAPD
ncbi:MAG: sugar phosphate nucleotidyltransferase, partial [Planctomycetota bacterium]